MRKLAPILFILTASAAAHAESPYAMLAKAKASWTYDVLDARTHKPTGAKVTATVASVHPVGPYQVIEWTTTATPADATDYQVPPMVLGPDGLRALLTMPEDFQTHQPDYAEATIAREYKDDYLPTIYLPTKLKKTSKRLTLGRFGSEDRDYKVTLTISKPDKHTWRAAWKGKYTVPESGETSRFATSVDFDPDRGLTQICLEDGTCLKLAAP